MAIPSTAVVWAETMDPYDRVDYTVDVASLLEGNSLDSFTIQPLAESMLLGLQVGVNEYGPTVNGTVIRAWFSIDDTKQGAAAFDNTGVNLPVEYSVVTNSIPARRRQRTMVLKVVQR